MRSARTTPSSTIPDVSSCFDRVPGEDRVLDRWAEMLAYFRKLASASDRIDCESIGQSTEGREMVMITVAHPDVIANLDHHRSLRSRLVDCELLRDPSLVDGGTAGSHTVVLVTSAIHATEVGSVQLCPELIHHFATSDDAETLAMLENVILLIVPSLNPDGMDLVHDWYEQTLGMKAEGTLPPALYHRFAGHDNNRDWIHHQLTETSNVVTHLHHAWRPHIVLDLHQMMTDGPRYFVPPYIDPIEQHVHPVLVAGGNALGAHIAARMVAHKLAGTTNGVLFDAFSPSRAYSHYHGGVRILAEAASARIASPIDVAFNDLTASRGFDPREPGVHNPLPWQGGTWRLRDIMDYHREAVVATAEHASRNRDEWIKRQWQVLADAVQQTPKLSFVIPPLEHQVDPAATHELIRIMAAGEVQIERLNHTVRDQTGVQHMRGSFLIRTDQPFGCWASALLPPTIYPEVAPTSRPYDTTTHSLSVHMGVEVALVELSDAGDTSALDLASLDRIRSLNAQRQGQGRWLALEARSHESIHVVSDALRAGLRVRRLVRSHFTDGRVLDAGTWILSGAALDAVVESAERLGVRSWSILPLHQGMVEQRQPKIGVHVPSRHNATDAGWTRLVLERHAIPHTILTDRDLQASDLSSFDVLLLSHLSALALTQRSTAIDYPDEFADVLGEAGFARLQGFVEAGGRIVAIDGAAQACIAQFELPVEVPLNTLNDTEFYAPGAMIRTEVDPHHPLTWGLPPAVPAMVNGKTAFRRLPDAAEFSAPLRYASEQIVASGWLRGESHLVGLDAMVDVPSGDGHVTLISLRPQFRGQTHVTFNLLFNALYIAGLES
ncbi:MAG: M14 family zinc carboxypeptidase [Thermomicrobiales bacterium]